MAILHHDHAGHVKILVKGAVERELDFAEPTHRAKKPSPPCAIVIRRVSAVTVLSKNTANAILEQAGLDDKSLALTL